MGLTEIIIAISIGFIFGLLGGFINFLFSKGG